METIAKKPTHIGWLDGLRGIATLGVFLGHYSDYIKFSHTEAISQTAQAVAAFPPVALLLNGRFYLWIFYVLSGYVVSMARVDGWRQLVERSVKRVLRFLLPVFGACIVIYALGAIFGFRTALLGEVLDNAQFAKFYVRPLTIADVFVDPLRVVFLGKSVCNNPFGVLGGMLVCSLAIYCYNAVEEALGRFRILGQIVLLAVCTVCYSVIGFGCCMGMVLQKNREYLRLGKHKRPICIAAAALAALLMFGGHEVIINFLSDRIGLFSLFHIRWDWYVFYICVLLWCEESGPLWGRFCTLHPKTHRGQFCTGGCAASAAW